MSPPRSGTDPARWGLPTQGRRGCLSGAFSLLQIGMRSEVRNTPERGDRRHRNRQMHTLVLDEMVLWGVLGKVL